MTRPSEAEVDEEFDPDYYNPDKVRDVIARVREAVKLQPHVARLGVEDIRTSNPVRYENLGEQGIYIATLRYLCHAWDYLAALSTQSAPLPNAEVESNLRALECSSEFAALSTPPLPSAEPVAWKVEERTEVGGPIYNTFWFGDDPERAARIRERVERHPYVSIVPLYTTPPLPSAEPVAWGCVVCDEVNPATKMHCGRCGTLGMRATTPPAAAQDAGFRGPLDYVSQGRDKSDVTMGITVKRSAVPHEIVTGDVYEMRKVADYSAARAAGGE